MTNWIDEPDLRMLVVRYEDLRENTSATFGRVIDYCGLNKDAQRLEKAIRFSQFEQSRKQEAEYSFNGGKAGIWFFFRNGQVCSWREELRSEMARKLIVDLVPVMRRFGYMDGNGDLDY